jgi:hypothetical protein
MLGILASVTISTSFNPISILAFVIGAIVYGTYIFLIYFGSKKRNLYPNPLPFMSIGLAAGFLSPFLGFIVFGPTLVFQTLAIIAITDAPVYIAYRLERYFTRKKPINIRHLLRNIFAVIFAVAPLLFFLSITIWVLILLVGMLTVSLNYFLRERP